MTNVTLAENIVSANGASASDMVWFVKKRVKEGKLEAFAVREGKAVKIKPDEIMEGRSVVLQHAETGQNYVFRADSRGGGFSEDGDQSIFDNTYFYKVETSLTLNKIAKAIGGEYGYLPSEMAISTLDIGRTTDWIAGANIDYVSGKSGKARVEGKKDSFFVDISKYIQDKC